MECLTEHQLNEYIDGSLYTDEMILIEKHLESCVECMKSYEALMNVCELFNDFSEIGFEESNNLENIVMEKVEFIQRRKKFVPTIIFGTIISIIVGILILQPYMDFIYDVFVNLAIRFIQPIAMFVSRIIWPFKSIIQNTGRVFLQGYIYIAGAILTGELIFITFTILNGKVGHSSKS